MAALLAQGNDRVIVSEGEAEGKRNGGAVTVIRVEFEFECVRVSARFRRRVIKEYTMSKARKVNGSLCWTLLSRSDKRQISQVVENTSERLSRRMRAQEVNTTMEDESQL